MLPVLDLTVVRRFMSTPVGFRYLYSADYIDREMEVWFNVRGMTISGQRDRLTLIITDEERQLCRRDRGLSRACV